MNVLCFPRVTAVGRLLKWCESPSPPVSLVVAAHCGCDLSRLEREVCERLNQQLDDRSAGFSAFDFEDIRHLAGDPAARRAILESGGLDPAEREQWNDYEIVLRALASMGGWVLCGRSALDATQRLPNVCRVMLSRCDECSEPGLSARVDPDRCRTGSIVEEISGQFAGWMEREAAAGSPPRRARKLAERLVAIAEKARV